MAYDFLCVIKMMIFSVITFATHTHTQTHSFAYNIPGNDTANQKQQISRNIRPSLLFTLWLIVYLVDIIFQIVINRWFFVCAFFAVAFFFLFFQPSSWHLDWDGGLMTMWMSENAFAWNYVNLMGIVQNATIYTVRTVHILKPFRQIIQIGGCMSIAISREFGLSFIESLGPFEWCFFYWFINTCECWACFCHFNSKKPLIYCAI